MRNRPIIIVAIAFVLVIMASAAFGQGGDNSSNSLTGLWQVAASQTVDCTTGVSDGEAPVPVNYLFNQGGTMTEEEANLFDGPYRASAQGIWKQVSGRRYLATFTNFAFNTDRTLAVILKFRTNIVLSKDGNSFTERGTADIALADGTLLMTACFADTGTRVQF